MVFENKSVYLRQRRLVMLKVKVLNNMALWNDVYYRERTIRAVFVFPSLATMSSLMPN